MVEIWIDGDRVEAEDGQTVMEAARASGHEIPFFCYHPALSVPFGFDDQGLPLAVQLVSARWHEGKLFALARALQPSRR